MNMRKPLGITLISYFYIFGMAIVFVCLFSPTANISGYSFSTVTGLTFLPDLAAKISLILFTAFVISGYFTQKIWGYWAMVGYSIYFLAVSAYMAGMHSWQPFAGTAVWSLVVLGYTLWQRKAFEI